MFYIYANGKSIFQPMDNTLSLFAPKLTLEMGKAGSLTFQIPPSNKYYNALNQLTTIVTVELDDTEIFRGRVLTNNLAFNKVRTIYCEGDLAYLVDSVQKGEKYDGKAHDLFKKIIAAHNKRVEAAKQFTVGNITIENRDVLLAGKSDDIEDAETGKFNYKQIAINSIANEWLTSFDYIEQTLIDYTGGYLRTRRQNGKTYIDLVTDYGSTSTQEIEFGKNMLDLTEEVSAEDVFTVLIPLGDENLTIETVNNGSDELVDATAVARYGRIVKTHVFDSVTNASTLLENGQRYLASNVNVPVTVTVKAVDLHLLDPNASPIYVGDVVHVNSVPHGMTDTLTCTKIEYDMENPANNTYTFGTPRQSLTERYRKDKKASEVDSHGAGAAGDAAAEEGEKNLDEFYDAWINVDPALGHIDLGALYEKYQDGKTVLKNQVGIDLDAPSGNINIKNLREEVDTNTDAITKQAARIDLINNETGARIDLIASWAKEFEGIEAGHYAALTVRADENESAIEMKAEKVLVDSIQTTLNATKEELTDTKDVLTKTCGISLDASGRNANVNITTLKKKVDDQGDEISANSTRIESVSSSLKSQITLEAKHHSDQADQIAAIEVKATKNESSIKLKANKTYVDSEILSVTGKIEAAEADIKTLKSDMAEVENLIAKKINALTLDTLIAKATIIKASIAISSGVSVTAPIINASTSMAVDGKAVATKEYVDGKVDDMATKTWVTNKGYMTSLPDNITVSGKVKAASMAIGIYTVATQYWCMTTKGFATQEWVKEQLKNYASSSHTHKYADITNKPSSFTPSSHTHSFEGSTTLAIGHTHSYTKPSSGGTSANTGGMSTNYSKKVEISGTTGKN